jgi:hypothetical protein
MRRLSAQLAGWCAALWVSISIPLARSDDDHMPWAIAEWILSPNGKYVVELWGNKDSLDSPHSAAVGFVASKDRNGVAGTETSIVNAAISNDARYVVLNFQISSGGDGGVYERSAGPRYRKILDNSFVLEQVETGRVRGLAEADFQKYGGRNIYFGLGLIPSSEQLLFTINARHLVFYSLKSRKITGWQRSILQLRGWREDVPGVFALRLDELSDTRGVVLSVCETRKNGGDAYEPLVTFLPSKNPVAAVAAGKEFHLESGTDGAIKLSALKVRAGGREEQPTWLVKITGQGATYDALTEKLAFRRESIRLSRSTKNRWITTNSYTASPE